MNTLVSSPVLHAVIDSDYETALEQVVIALKAAGFEIVGRVKLTELLEKKLNAHIAPYEVVVVCNPDLTRQALLVAPETGAMLVVNVAVSQVLDHQVDVRAVEPMIMMGDEFVSHLKPIVAELNARLERAIDSLNR